jgi:serine/threonine-protein kinase
MTLPYRILQRLGHGSMAEVMLVERDGDDGVERVALKRVLPVYLHDEAVVGMFIDEARLLRYLDHPSIPRLLELSFFEGEPFMLLELIEGTSLDELVTEGPLPLPAALEVACRVADALAHAHAVVDEAGRHLGVVHRDVRPGNVMVTRDGDVKLIDFGIARWADRARLTEAGHTVGAAGYLAPEQVRGEPATPASDVYSLALVLVEITTKARLFSQRDVTARLAAMTDPGALESLAAVPEPVRPIVTAALEPDPARRLPDGAALVAALEPVRRLADRAALAARVAPEAIGPDSMDMPHTAVPSGEGGDH